MSLTMVEPAHFWMPDRAGSFGYEAVDLCKMAGWEFDPEQEFAIDANMSHDKHGQWTANEFCVICARQNGKTNRILIPRALWQLYLGPVDDVIWTAHRFVTSTQAFKDIKKLIDGCYDLRKHVKSILESYGKETIELNNGSVMRFLARSESGGRGLGGPCPVLDEAFALKEGQLGALLPTILARPDAQIQYGSSGALKDSTHLRDLVERGRGGGDPSLIYIEWCAPGSWAKPGCELEKCDHHKSRRGCTLDDESNWERANFALDRRIKRRTVRTLRNTFPPAQFAREIMTWHDEDPEGGKSLPIGIADWQVCGDEESQIDLRKGIVLSAEVSTDLEYGSISLAGYTADGIPQLEMIRYEPGTDWMVPALLSYRHKYRLCRINIAQGKDRDLPRNKRLVQAIILDPAGPASVLLPALTAKRITPVMVTLRDLGTAYSTIQSELAGKALAHLNQPEVELALEGSLRRNIGDGLWCIARKKSADEQVDISPLNGLALARWGLLKAEPPPTGDGPQVYVL